MPVLMADVPIHQRPRERLIARGVDALTDHELIALVLRQGCRGESALDLAAALVADCGGLEALATARPEELARRRGVGKAKAAALVAAFQLGRLVSAIKTDVARLQCPDDVFLVARSELAGLRREHVLVLVCDAANRLRRTETVAAGALDRSILPIREILNCVLRHDGRAFAVAHNHPSGDPSPSNADENATRALNAAATAVGLRFLDHVIVAGDRWARVSA